MLYIVLDTEATGLERVPGLLSKPTSVNRMGSEVIQLGGLYCDDEMRPIKAFCHYCDCLAAHSSAQAFAVHKIQLEDIRQRLAGVFLEEVIATRLPEFYNDDVTFIGYNALFDVSMTIQCIRDFPVRFKHPKRVGAKLPAMGRHFIDVMDFLGPQKRKLVSYREELKPWFDAFMAGYEETLPVDSNIPELFQESWVHAHNSLYDSICTYLLFLQKVWGIKLVRGGVRGQRA